MFDLTGTIIILLVVLVLAICGKYDEDGKNE